jgi:hypothetical protein
LAAESKIGSGRAPRWPARRAYLMHCRASGQIPSGWAQFRVACSLPIAKNSTRLARVLRKPPRRDRQYPDVRQIAFARAVHLSRNPHQVDRAPDGAIRRFCHFLGHDGIALRAWQRRKKRLRISLTQEIGAYTHISRPQEVCLVRCGDPKWLADLYRDWGNAHWPHCIDIRMRHRCAE